MSVAHSLTGPVQAFRNLAAVALEARELERLALDGDQLAAIRGVERLALEGAVMAAREVTRAPGPYDGLFTVRSLREAQDDFERRFIAAGLRQVDGSVAALARAIGMNRAALSRKLSRLGIKRT